jgi:hypothetical protein
VADCIDTAVKAVQATELNATLDAAGINARGVQLLR